MRGTEGAAPLAAPPLRLAFAPMKHLPMSGIALAVVAAAGLTACAPSAGKFSAAAEDYIESEEVATWAQQQRFSAASCTEPASTKVDTTFQCTADSTDGNSYVFQVIITGERRFRVEAVQPG